MGTRGNRAARFRSGRPNRADRRLPALPVDSHCRIHCGARPGCLRARIFSGTGTVVRVKGNFIMTRHIRTIIKLSLIASSAFLSQAADTTIEQMPAKLETQYALSALPPAMRDHATVYLLDPKKGYQLSRERTAWEQDDFRNDIYVPLCYDAEGSKTYLKVIMDVAALRIQGMNPVALKTEIERRYKNKTYKIPQKTGLSYMVAPVMRTWMMPDWQVHTMPMPHLMFYAPNMTNEDIGSGPSSFPGYPFVFKEGIPEQSYMIQLAGEAERVRIVTEEKPLLDELCSYREVLCIPHIQH